MDGGLTDGRLFTYKLATYTLVREAETAALD